MSEPLEWEDEKTDPGLRVLRKSISIEWGLIKPLIDDENISEILVNGLSPIYIEKNGRLSAAGIRYHKAEDLTRLAEDIVYASGSSREQFIFDFLSTDRVRVNLVLPPLVEKPALSIRKFTLPTYNLEQLFRSGLGSKNAFEFLSACFLGRKNILISGGTSTGKTTLLNAFIQLTPADQRIILIEDIPELNLKHPNSVQLHPTPPGQTPEVTSDDLVKNALRMRPDRLIVGECRGAEVLSMLQAMNTGHSGSMGTVHANSPREALTRIETLCLLGGYSIPIEALRRQISQSIDLIVQLTRLPSGQRIIDRVTEVTGFEGLTNTLQDIFLRSDTETIATGSVPTLFHELQENGSAVDLKWFANE